MFLRVVTRHESPGNTLHYPLFRYIYFCTQYLGVSHGFFGWYLSTFILDRCEPNIINLQVYSIYVREYQHLKYLSDSPVA